MPNSDARNLHDLQRDAARARADLTDTVDRLKGAAGDFRGRLAPDSIKADVRDYIRTRADEVMDAARRNPLQAAAVGALAAWPLMRLARAIPAPVLMIGAGLALSGTKTGKDMARKANDGASDLLDQGARAAHDIRDRSAEAIDAISGAAAQARAASGEMASRAADAVSRTGGSIADAAHDVKGNLHDIKARSADAATHGMKSAAAVAGEVAESASGMADRAGQAAGRVVDAATDISGRAADEAHRIVAASRDAIEPWRRQSVESADRLMQWAKENPLIVGGVGLLIGGFIASAIPTTPVERDVANKVTDGLGQSARHIVGGAVSEAKERVANVGVTPDAIGAAARDYGGRALKVAEAAAAAALGEPSTTNDQPAPLEARI